MSRELRPLVALALVALISPIGTGCGSNAPSEPSAASNAGTATNADTGSAKNASSQDKAVKFAECMRNNGVGDFPDPTAKGEFVYGVSVTPAVWTKATRACKDLEPPGALSGKRTPKQQSASLEFARCMRDNGVKDFPDPANGEPLVDTGRIPSTDRPSGMTILNAAMQKCGRVLGLAAGGQG